MYLVNIDAGVIEFADCPIAYVPQQGAGLEARRVISCPRFSGPTITEANPDHHAGEEGGLLRGFAESIAETPAPLGRKDADHRSTRTRPGTSAQSTKGTFLATARVPAPARRVLALDR